MLGSRLGLSILVWLGWLSPQVVRKETMEMTQDRAGVGRFLMHDVMLNR